MDKDTIDDLKQFIATTISQQVSFHTGELRDDIRQLDKKVDDKIDALDRKLSTKIDDHEVRLGKLEAKAA